MYVEIFQHTQQQNFLGQAQQGLMKLEVASYKEKIYGDVYEYKKSALANCHAKGLYSIVLKKFDDGRLLRIFYASRTHDLWKNNFKALQTRQQPLSCAIHSHHSDIQIHGLYGTMVNIRCKIEKKHTYKKQNNLKAFRYTSSITNGTKNGKFVLEGSERLIVKTLENIHSDTAVSMRADELHTVYVPKGQEAAWMILEGKEDKDYSSLCYSDDDLTKFPFEQYYQPIDELKVAEVLCHARLLPGSIDYHSFDSLPKQFCVGGFYGIRGVMKLHFAKKTTNKLYSKGKYIYHRLNGPAIIEGYDSNDYKESYYINDISLTKEQFLNHSLVLTEKLDQIIEL